MLATWIFLMLNELFFSLRLGSSGSFPRPLKAEEERQCLEKMAQGDGEARNTLIEHNLRLVAHIVKKYYTQTGDQDDLISIGTIGLIKGISTFKADKNVRLATYASRCIENAILSQRRGAMCCFAGRQMGRGVRQKEAAGIYISAASFCNRFMVFSRSVFCCFGQDMALMEASTAWACTVETCLRRASCPSGLLG